jgi:DNA-directed RNA polymerase subunit F
MAKFRTKARAVDMLGRQQIADASTAISELFKNAHDAYADRVEVDFFRSDYLLVIRDDGTGMTSDEFESNWLVLGTDNKVAVTPNMVSYRPADKPERAVMGEKGIGRLAIAFLGSQVLVLTRSQKPRERDMLTMCYVHWGLFEQPSLNLEDIEIPIRRITGGRVASDTDVRELLRENAKNIEELQRRFPQCNLRPILDDLSDFQVDPTDFEESVRGLSLSNRQSGTHFYVAPANETILADIQAEKDTDTKEFSKCLLGFSNGTFAVDSPPSIRTAFRFWSTDSTYEDLIGPGEFFTREDLSLSDQFVSGDIDEYGQFRGTVRVYDKEYKNHVITWKDGGGKPTECGPFRVEFGYLQGNQRESMADPDDWARLDRKLKHIGGLYVYRNGIRILPYGNSDVDWLDIELRRNKGMTYYFFSYRRIYGAVCMTRTRNSNLREKAGREGFQKDKAYRHLKSVLENLFLQLAADFFRKEASLGDYFQERKGEVEKMQLARRKREKQTTTKRANLTEALNVFFLKTRQQVPESEVAALNSHVQARMQLASKMSDPEDASRELLDAELEANRKLSDLRATYSVIRPRGVGLTKQLMRDWEAYQREYSRLETELFAPLGENIGRTLGSMAEQAKIYIDQRRRLQELIHRVADEQNKIMRTEASALQQTTGQTRRAAINTARSALRELRNAIEAVNDDLAHRDIGDLLPHQIEEIRSTYEQRINVVATKNTETLAGVRELLVEIAESLEQNIEVNQLDIVEAMETELQSFREQSETDEELVQLGLAVAVINHEFVAAIKMIRSQLRELRSWAQANNDLLPIYQEIRTNFDHLDAHLNLFTPLQRRLYRQRIDIQGKEIAHYVRSLFSVRFDRHRIELNATPAFLDSNVHSYPSTIYPVFVNLIDNFVFWLKDQPGPRLITLNCTGSVYHIENNGPAVPKRDWSAIFERGFSRKPGGRGLGLFISRKVLQKEGMNLDLDTQSDPENGVRFNVSWGDDND